MNDTDPNKDQPTKIYTYLHRRRLLKLICLTGAGLLIGACDYRSAGPMPDVGTKENNEMKATATTTNFKPQLPPLDAIQPQEIKTATFALG